MTPEEQKAMETPIEAKTGEKRLMEAIIGRQKLKKSYTYEVKFKHMDHKVSNYLLPFDATAFSDPNSLSSTPGFLASA